MEGRLVRWLAAVTASALVSALGITGCADRQSEAEALRRLQKGELIDQMNQDRAKAENAQKAAQPMLGASGAVPAGLSSFNHCANQARPDASGAVTVGDLYACFRGFYSEPDLWDLTLNHYRKFRRSGKDLALKPSELTTPTLLSEMKNLVPQMNYGFTWSLPEEPRGLLRMSFSDVELDEVIALNKNRQQAYREAERKVLETVGVFAEQLAAAPGNRGKALLALRDTALDLEGGATVTALFKTLGNAYSPRAATAPHLPYGLLHPYATRWVIGDAGLEHLPIQRHENPFFLLEVVGAGLEGSDVDVAFTRMVYSNLRDADNKTAEQAGGGQITPKKDAVRVGFLDSGVDYVRYDGLRRYLGLDSKSGRLNSHDYADGDGSPWEPFSGSMGHGSATTASMLTILSNIYPKVLEEKRLDLAMWKVFTNRVTLAGNLPAYANMWENRPYGFMEALIEQLSRPKEEQAHVISVSMVFPAWILLAGTAHEDLINDSHALLVMAAGNSGVPVELAARRACLIDLPAEKRPRDHILCVGALIQGVTAEDDQIAEYSNTGDAVDVYAWESFFKMCPNGTSCATPSMTAVAAALKAAYPQLSAPMIREIMIEAAEIRELPIENRFVIDPVTKKATRVMLKVRTLNPLNARDKVMRIAELKLKQRAVVHGLFEILRTF